MTLDLYEQAPFRAAAGNEFRPGGLDLTEELIGECHLQPGERVLDLGCGVGSTSRFMAQRWGVSVVGLDASARFLAEAEAGDDRDCGGGRDRDRGPDGHACPDDRVSWVLGRADDIPYPDGYFDAVVSECFLSALDEPVRVLEEIQRVLRPPGRLAVTDVYLRKPEALVTLPPSRPLPAAACLRGAAGQEKTLEWFEEAGFEVLTWRDHSEALASLVASLIFTYGSAAAFWGAAIGYDPAVREVVTAARPGYYLLLAEPRSPAEQRSPSESRGAAESESPGATRPFDGNSAK
jgi:ubiquinone/menaquinone biosynthesis C-methylase UbiE